MKSFAMAGTLVGFSLAVSVLSRRPRDDARGYFGWFVIFGYVGSTAYWD